MDRKRPSDERGSGGRRTRRAALVGTAAFVSLSGCLGLFGDGTDGGGDEEDPGGAPATASPGPTTAPATTAGPDGTPTGTDTPSTTSGSDQPTTVWTTADPITTTRLAARTDAWVGQQPASISGVENPTLRLEVGQPCELLWENRDGRLHELRVMAVDPEDRLSTSRAAREGAVVGTRFVAGGSMVAYHCTHQPSMYGEIERVW